MRASARRAPAGIGMMLGLLLCGLAAAAPHVGAAASDKTGDTEIAGRWVIDPERSDSPERASRSALRDVRRVLEPRGPNAPPSGRTPDERARSVLAPLTPPRSHVHIELGDGEVIFRFDDRAPRRHYTDGRAGIIDSARPQVGFAAWEDGRLYVEQAFDGGTRIVESWYVEAGRLHAHYEMRNSLFREPVRFTLQFRREVTSG